MRVYSLNLIRSASFYPIGTFWLISMVVLPSIISNWIELDTGLLLLTVTAIALILIAYRRDTVALRKDIRIVYSQLIAFEESGIAIPTDTNPQEGLDG